jgi:hypothetical protein
MFDPIASVFGVVYDKLVGAIITLLGISHLISITILLSLLYLFQYLYYLKNIKSDFE